MMKKLTAMLLALCMLLAAVPALGDSAAGYWYITMADVNVGYFQLNEDGTAEMKSGDELANGTWTEDGTNVTITIDGQPLTVVCDGASLINEAFYPMSVTREAGRLSMDIMAKMLNGEEYELPEGVTEEEAQAIESEFMAKYVILMGYDTGEAEPEPEPEAQQAESQTPVVTIVKSTFLVAESYSGYRGHYIARVKNENDVPLFLTGGSVQVFDQDGNQVGEATYLSQTGSKYLEPGETSFVSMNVDLENDGQYSYKAAIETKTESYRSTDYAVKTADPVFVSQSGYDLMKVTVFNETDAYLPGIKAVMVLSDADGNLLDITTEDMYRDELGPNSSIILVSSGDSYVKKFYEAAGLVPVTVEAYAWVENDD